VRKQPAAGNVLDENLVAMKTWDSIIVGAGPCGLSCAASLTGAGLSALVLEQGCLVDSIYRFPDGMRFFSGPEGLEVENLPLRCSGQHPTRSEALVYYGLVARHFELDVRTSKAVVRIDGTDGNFHVRTPSELYRAQKVVIATGYYGWPNLLNIPGGSLPKVMHYFKDAHPYAGLRVMVIGGRNSAGNVALALVDAGAEVTLVHRKDRFSMKPWILDAVEQASSDGGIHVYRNTQALEIGPHSVLLCTPGRTVEVENDFVFAMTGYHRDHAFLNTNRIPMAPDPNTLESGRRGIYLAGALLSGLEGCEVNIENGRAHGARILQDLSVTSYM
jgi:thioredoxin reductase (NADPH)